MKPFHIDAEPSIYQTQSVLFVTACIMNKNIETGNVIIYLKLTESRQGTHSPDRLSRGPRTWSYNVAFNENDDESAEQHIPTPPPRIGMEPHKIHVMQAAVQSATAMGKSKPRLHADKLLNASISLSRKHRRNYDTVGDGGMVVDKLRY